MDKDNKSDASKSSINKNKVGHSPDKNQNNDPDDSTDDEFESKYPT